MKRVSPHGVTKNVLSNMYPLFYAVVSEEKQFYDQHNAAEADSFGFVFKCVVTVNFKTLLFKALAHGFTISGHCIGFKNIFQCFHTLNNL